MGDARRTAGCGTQGAPLNRRLPSEERRGKRASANSGGKRVRRHTNNHASGYSPTRGVLP